MLRTIGSTVVVGVLMVISATSVQAAKKFHAEKLKDGLYFISYQTSGNSWGSSEKKASRKLEVKLQRFCVEEGYRYYHIPTILEVAEDDELKDAWDIVAGDTGMHSSTAGTWFSTRTDTAKRLLRLSKETADGFEKRVVSQ